MTAPDPINNPPPGSEAGPDAHAAHAAGLIDRFFGVTLDGGGRAGLRVFFARVGPDNRADLAASLFLECWAIRTAGGTVTADEVRRAADRVRQRLVRDAARHVPTEAVGQTAAVQLPPDDEADLVAREFGTVLRGRSPLDAALFQRYYLDGVRDVPALAAECGLSAPTVYRRLADIRAAYLALRDLHQPPHATD